MYSALLSAITGRHIAAGAGRQSRRWLHQSSTTTSNATRTKQPIHILGAGSIGCLLGAQLSQQGFPVTFLQRSPPPPLTASPILQLVREGQSSEFPVCVESTQTHSSSTARPIDRLIVATKAHQLSLALSSLGPRFDPRHTALVLVQNGYGQHLDRASPLQLAASCNGIGWGSTNNGAYLATSQPNYWRSVVHAGVGQWHFGPISLVDPFTSSTSTSASFDLASISPHATATLLYDLAHFLPSATLHATSSAMTAILLHKLAINSVINALTATHRVRNGALLDRAYLPVIRALAHESAAVLRATCPPETFTLSGDQVLDKAKHVCEVTHHNFSSTYQDVWDRGEVPRELEYVHGTIVAWGKRAGVPTGTHEEVWDRVVKRARERERWRREQERQRGERVADMVPRYVVGGGRLGGLVGVGVVFVLASLVAR